MLTAIARRAWRIRGALSLFGGVSVIAVGLAQSQTETAAPKFEVASLKRCGSRDSSGGGGRGSEGGGGEIFSNPGTLRANCVTLASLIPRAYLNDKERAVLNPHFVRLLHQRVQGGPSWVRSDLYRIEAKAAGKPSEEVMTGPMMRVLLEDRFELQVHRETKAIPVYALSVAKNGPKLPPEAQEGSCIPVDLDHPFVPPAPGQPLPLVCGRVRVTNAGYDTYGQTMQGLCLDFSVRLGQEVIDKTGIKGMFDIHLEIPRSSLLPGFPAGGTPDAVRDPTVFAAPPDPAEIFALIGTAVQRLGLKLERTMGPDEFLVVDHVEKPSEN